jgi:hypothetical protein
MDIDKFNSNFYTDFIKRYNSKIRQLEKIGLIVYDQHNIAVRPEKMYLLNSIILEFMDD